MNDRIKNGCCVFNGNIHCEVPRTHKSYLEKISVRMYVVVFVYLLVAVTVIIVIVFDCVAAVTFAVVERPKASTKCSSPLLFIVPKNLIWGQNRYTKVCFEFFMSTFSINFSFYIWTIGLWVPSGSWSQSQASGANYHHGNRFTGWGWVELECKEMFLTSFLTNAAQLYHFTDLNKLGIKSFTYLVYFCSTLKPELENVARTCLRNKITNFRINCLVFNLIKAFS